MLASHINLKLAKAILEELDWSSRSRAIEIRRRHTDHCDFMANCFHFIKRPTRYIYIYLQGRWIHSIQVDKLLYPDSKLCFYLATVRLNNLPPLSND